MFDRVFYMFALLYWYPVRKYTNNVFHVTKSLYIYIQTALLKNIGHFIVKALKQIDVIFFIFFFLASIDVGLVRTQYNIV